jgi:subtilisin family serine protease
MPVRLAPAVVDALLLGPEDRRRQLQDFPVLGDVWAKFADEPGGVHDLLIIPTRERPTGEVVSLISDDNGGDPEKGCAVAYLQDLVVASFDLDHLYRVLIPATSWWDQVQDCWKGELPEPPLLVDWIRLELRDALGERRVIRAPGAEETEEMRTAATEWHAFERLGTHCRQAAKLGLLLGVFITAAAAPDAEERGPDTRPRPLTSLAEVASVLGRGVVIERGAEALRAVIRRHRAFEVDEEAEWNGVIFQVTLNRSAEAALAESVPAIKADAARQLFSISCRDIGWAVIDSGIDFNHEAFLNHEPTAKRKHRVRAAYDFRRIRAILGVTTGQIEALADELARHNVLPADQIFQLLTDVAKDRVERRPLDWRKIQRLITLDIDGVGDAAPTADVPSVPHGTHVAGIIGADWRDEKTGEVKLRGVCPDIQLFDFRVLGSDLGDSEFAVTAALQFVRFLNEQSGPRINGVNMSLAIRHNVRNYACGRTPVCLEAEALVANGVVVVAAAGNRGYQLYQLADSTTFESYAASSITDPGNAESVITVGATHRQWPHTFGVSFFSSRGPTGDGRLKPDLLAPGEKILSCIPNGRQDQMDGTSMAAPHVSGAAALLMGRHKEFKDKPSRIKQILCETATDLGRERSFQGNGMVDVLRAIQSI